MKGIYGNLHIGLKLNIEPSFGNQRAYSSSEKLDFPFLDKTKSRTHKIGQE